MNFNKQVRYLQNYGKLKIMRANIVDEYVTHTMTTRDMKSVQ